MGDAIRWFKCKLKPPKNVGKTFFIQSYVYIHITGPHQGSGDHFQTTGLISRITKTTNLYVCMFEPFIGGSLESP